MPHGAEFIAATRESARRAGIRFFDVNDPEQGIGHVIAAELGIVLPGTSVVCPDSHTCTLGSLGALAWGIGSTEAEHALATGTLRVARPRSMRVFLGRRRPGGRDAQGSRHSPDQPLREPGGERMRGRIRRSRS